MPCMRYSTQGTATELPRALYLEESEAPGRSVHPGGNPCSNSHSCGTSLRMSCGPSTTSLSCPTYWLLGPFRSLLVRAPTVSWYTVLQTMSVASLYWRALSVETASLFWNLSTLCRA